MDWLVEEVHGVVIGLVGGGGEIRRSVEWTG